MSINATDEVVSRSATLRATVDLPEPDPPAMPMIKGFSIRVQSYAERAWNALCFFAKQQLIRNYNEGSRSRGFACATDVGSVQRIQTRSNGIRSERADGGTGRQSGIPRYGSLRREKLGTRPHRHRQRKSEDQS